MGECRFESCEMSGEKIRNRFVRRVTFDERVRNQTTIPAPPPDHCVDQHLEVSANGPLAVCRLVQRGDGRTRDLLGISPKRRDEKPLFVAKRPAYTASRVQARRIAYVRNRRALESLTPEYVHGSIEYGCFLEPTRPRHPRELWLFPSEPAAVKEHHGEFLNGHSKIREGVDCG